MLSSGVRANREVDNTNSGGTLWHVIVNVDAVVLLSRRLHMEQRLRLDGAIINPYQKQEFTRRAWVCLLAPGVEGAHVML